MTTSFRIPKGTLCSRYVQLYLSFFLSGLIHHIGVMNVPYTIGVSYQVFFYMIQPLAITVEDAVIHWGKKVGIKEGGEQLPASSYCW